MHAQKTDPPIHSRRSGFTLVEIMVVVVIIGILASILVPVLGGIIRRTNEAAVKVEIHSLENAIADFKTKFGCDPPDHIFLYEFTNGWANDSQSRAKIIRIWPRFNFNFPQGRYLNNDSDTLDTIHLSGAECLVFFLGGMPNYQPLEDKNGNNVLDSGEDANGNGHLDIKFYMTGFSKSPTNPFARVALGQSESRVGPFFEFPSARLKDHEVSPVSLDDFPEFRDSLNNQTAPYLYLSSHGGRGYADHGGFVFHFGFGNAPNPNLPTPNSNLLFWNRNYPYRQSAGGPYWKTRTFQIISPGYGPHENTAGQFCPYGTADVYDPENTNELSPLDADNITNFSQGSRLKP